MKQNLTTKEMGQYLVLRMNFDEVSPEGDVRTNFRNYINHVAQTFSNKYYEAKLLNRRVEVDPTSEWSTLHSLFGEVKLSGREIYLIIDECDAFINKLLFRVDTSQSDLGCEQYKRSVVDKEKMIIYWGELIKSGTSGAISRAFLTGAVSQALYNGLAGMDMVWNSTFGLKYEAMFGFTSEDVRRGLQTAQPALTQTQQLEHLEYMQRYYGGYRFHRQQKEAVFDPQSVLYYLGHLAQTEQPPSDPVDPALLRDNHEAAHFLINNHAMDGPYTLQTFVLGHAPAKEMETFELKTDPFFRSWDLFNHRKYDALVTLSYCHGFLTHTYSGDRRCTLTSANLSTQTVLLRHLLSALPSAQMSQLEAWLRGSSKPDVNEFERMVKLAMEDGSKATGRDLVSELGPKLTQVTGRV